MLTYHYLRSRNSLVVINMYTHTFLYILIQALTLPIYFSHLPFPPFLLRRGGMLLADFCLPFDFSWFLEILTEYKDSVVEDEMFLGFRLTDDVCVALPVFLMSYFL